MTLNPIWYFIGAVSAGDVIWGVGAWLAYRKAAKIETEFAPFLNFLHQITPQQWARVIRRLKDWISEGETEREMNRQGL